jgi:hypothetical protein
VTIGDFFEGQFADASGRVLRRRRVRIDRRMLSPLSIFRFS